MFSEKDIERAEWASEMAQQVKVLTANPAGLSSIPETHVMDGETDSQKLSSDYHTSAGAWLCLYSHTIMHHAPTPTLTQTLTNMHNALWLA